MQPDVTIIVRTKNSAKTLRATLMSLKSQTAPCEIIVVDSGSSDETLAIAHEFETMIVEMSASAFTFGRALNLGASHARTPIVGALSSHSTPFDSDWIATALRHFDDERIVAASGAIATPEQQPLEGAFLQDKNVADRYPGFGFTNTGSFWRASAWKKHPFDESLEANEDKEWSWRVLADGYLVAFDRALVVSSHHRENQGLRSLWRRNVRESRVHAQLVGESPRPWRELPHDWWFGSRGDIGRVRLRRKLNPMRTFTLIARHVGQRQGARNGRQPTRLQSSTNTDESTR